MGLLTSALTTVQRFKDFREINDNNEDTLIERLINATTAYVQRYCGRTFLLTTYTNQEYDGDGSRILRLRNYPVTTVTSLERRGSAMNTNTWSTISDDFYFIQTENGLIKANFNFVRLVKAYRVTYSAGYDYDQAAKTLESIGLGDLEYAVWKLVSDAYNDRMQSGNVQSESIGDYSVTFSKTVSEDPEVKQILDSYCSYDF